MNTLRPELEALPKRMRNLPLDKRGYPVPWFVPWIDGEPEFRGAATEKFIRAIRHKRCWVCGDELGRIISFVAGPMCGVNRTSSEPPSHRDCAEWSARNCPFLTLREVKRREDDFTRGCPMSGHGLPHNPGVCLVWTTEYFRVFKVPNDQRAGGRGLLIEMGEPICVEFFHRGRKATREEIEAAMAKGYPELVKLAEEQERDEPHMKAMEYLHQLRLRFEKLLPPAVVHLPDCDVNDRNPDGIVKPCNCFKYHTPIINPPKP